MKQTIGGSGRIKYLHFFLEFGLKLVLLFFSINHFNKMLNCQNLSENKNSQSSLNRKLNVICGVRDGFKNMFNIRFGSADNNTNIRFLFMLKD